MKIYRLLLLLLLALAASMIMAGWLFAANEKKSTEATIDADAVRVVKVNGETVTTYTNAVILHQDATFSASLIEQRTNAQKQHQFNCSGRPRFKDSVNTITTDLIVAFTSPRSADCSGNVRTESMPRSGKELSVKAQKIIVTSDKLHYDYAAKLADFSADKQVTMQLIPLTPSANDDGTFSGQLWKETTDINSKSLRYDFNAKLALAEGNVVVTQPKRTLWADKATYDESLDLIVMTGNIRMRNSGDDEIKALDNADKLTVSLIDNWLEILAKSPDKKLRFTIEVDEDE